MSQTFHKSVLLNEMLTALEASNAGTYIDATFGAGGYSRAILEANSSNKVIAFDRDGNVKKFADQLASEFKERFKFINSRFSKIKPMLEEIKVFDVDGIVFDLGVSSMQLDEAERGFSFNKNAKLSMEMGDNELSAYDVVNNYSESELADIIYNYGEERASRRIARFICKAREEKAIETTEELADVIIAAIGLKPGQKIHPATKTFQAIRIFINEELQELKEALAATISLLVKGGRLVVVSFHGLEDRIVKNFIRDEGKGKKQNRYLPDLDESEEYNLKIIVNGQKPGDFEVKNNPRSRSAILRAAERL